MNYINIVKKENEMKCDCLLFQKLNFWKNKVRNKKIAKKLRTKNLFQSSVNGYIRYSL